MESNQVLRRNKSKNDDFVDAAGVAADLCFKIESG